MSSLTVEEDQKWVPTHVQVTVLKGRGLRGKGKHGTSDVYTIIQLGKEKYSTGVAEKTTEPEWREECSFELQPCVLEGGRDGGYPAGSSELVLTAMHRALIGLDVFLGQTVIQLDKVFHEGRCVKNQWYRLNSKTGKKEKERGDIQVTIQFTRNNLTASMYDLVMKDKGASTFSKLKERMMAKRKSSDEDSSSAVLPSGYSSLYRMRQRLPSDGGGEEDYEDDEGGEVRRSKMRTFFLRGKLRKSPDTRSSTSLGSESSESSSRGGSLSPTAGISVVVSDLSNSPSNSSNLTADNSPEHTANTSPKSSIRCEYGNEAGEISIVVPQPTICVNGNFANSIPPDSGKPEGSLGLRVLEKSLPLSVSLQNLSTRPFTDLPKGPMGDGRRWSVDRPGEEEKAAITVALKNSSHVLGEKEEHSEQAESEIRKKQKKNLFSHGRSESAGKRRSKDESEQVSGATEEKPRSWFGSKDAHSRPSPVFSTKLKPSTDPHPPPLPSSRHPECAPIDPPSVFSTLHHTNPFCHSQATLPLISHCNPFYSVLHQNPFYNDMFTDHSLNSSPPPLPYLSSSRPPITDLFPPSSDSKHNSACGNVVPDTHSNCKEMSQVRERPLPPVPGDEDPTLMKKSSNPFVAVRDPEWDDSFEVFAARRLQSTEDCNPECRAQQNTASDHPLEQYLNKGESQPVTDGYEHSNNNDSMYCQPAGRLFFETLTISSHLKNNNALHFDGFPQFLETIPENRAFESDDITLKTCAESPDPRLHAESGQSGNSSHDVPEACIGLASFHPSSVQLHNSSPEPSSSGLGSSAEDDGMSCVSTQCDKLSASSSSSLYGEAESFKMSSEPVLVKNVKSPQSDDGIADMTDSSKREGLSISESALPCPDFALALLNTERKQQSEGGAEQASNTPDLLPLPEFVLSPQLDNDSQDDIKVSCHEQTEMEIIPGSPKDEFISALPPVLVTTSSPDIKLDLLEASSGNATDEQDAISCVRDSFDIFGDALNISNIAQIPSQNSDNFLHTPSSVLSSSSLLQSLYASADSQTYQTCDSHMCSDVSVLPELNDTLDCVNSTLRGEISDIQGANDAQMELLDDYNQTEKVMVPFIGAQDKTLNVETSVTAGGGSPILSEPSPDVSRNLKSLSGDEAVFLKTSQNATLQRSNSDGKLAPALDQSLLPSFGSDPCMIQEFSPSLLGPDLQCPNSFPPPLTPETSSSSLALSACSFFENIPATKPLGAAQGTEPKPGMEESEPPQQAAVQQSSPHPVKPLTTSMLADEKRSVLATGLEKLKSTIHPGKSSQTAEQETDGKKSLTEGAGSYYHLTHSELIALLVRRDMDLERQKVEFEQQKRLLAKREVELKKLKPQVRDLEDYIDTLLVRIMEQKPTLLQVRSKLK